MSVGLEKVLRQAVFIADIYQQFPHCYKFIIHPEAQQQFEDSFHIIYSSCFFVVNALRETPEEKYLRFPESDMDA